MCGIFGFSVGTQSSFTPRAAVSTIKDLFQLSESRGKEAAGLAILRGDTIEVYKAATSATTFIHSGPYRSLLERAFDSGRTQNGFLADPITVIGHSRLVTNGS